MHRPPLPAALAAGALLAGAGGTTAAPIVAELLVSGLDRPVWAAAPPGDPRLFVVEQGGYIRIVENGTLRTRPFLDIAARVNDEGFEQGLLGLAFHPSYASNGRFFVYYTAGSGSGTSVVERYTASADADSADPASGRLVLQVFQPFPNHNGGHLAFAPDGTLYLGLGDGGGAGDPGDRAQDGQVLLGKMLRLDVDGDDFPADSTRNYAIPPDNPFVGDPAVRDEIWALGLRNPYRFSFDPLTGDLWIGDVGQGCWEEIDIAAASAGGANFGWDIREGSHCFDETNFANCLEPPCGSGLVDPLYEYAHTGGACSVTGGVVYRGARIPAIEGHYFFGDWCTGRIQSLAFDGSAVTDTLDWTAALDPPGPARVDEIVAFAEDGWGELLLVDRQGEVFRVVPEATEAPETLPGAEAHLAMGPLRPNPSAGPVAFAVRLARPAPLRVEVYSAAGRLVRRLHAGRAAAGTSAFRWDGRDALGRPVPAGTYFLRAESAGAKAARRLTILR